MSRKVELRMRIRWSFYKVAKTGFKNKQQEQSDDSLRDNLFKRWFRITFVYRH